MSRLTIEQIEEMEQIGMVIADKIQESYNGLESTCEERENKLNRLRENLNDISRQLREDSK